MGLFIWKSLRLAVLGLARSAHDWVALFGINHERTDALIAHFEDIWYLQRLDALLTFLPVRSFSLIKPFGITTAQWWQRNKRIVMIYKRKCTWISFMCGLSQLH